MELQHIKLGDIDDILQNTPGLVMVEPCHVKGFKEIGFNLLDIRPKHFHTEKGIEDSVNIPFESDEQFLSDFQRHYGNNDQLCITLVSNGIKNVAESVKALFPIADTQNILIAVLRNENKSSTQSQPGVGIDDLTNSSVSTS